MTARLDAVDDRHLHVHQHEIGGLRAELLQRGAGRVRNAHLHAGPAQRLGVDRRHQLVVVNDEDRVRARLRRADQMLEPVRELLRIHRLEQQSVDTRANSCETELE
jgi:hypothetical protein